LGPRERGQKTGIGKEIVGLAQLPTTQINGCSVCVDMHCRQMKPAGESDERLFFVAAWWGRADFTDSERTALALAESVTRLSDREDPVPEDVWTEAARHFNENELARLILAVAVIEVCNRFNVTPSKRLVRTGEVGCLAHRQVARLPSLWPISTRRVSRKSAPRFLPPGQGTTEAVHSVLVCATGQGSENHCRSFLADREPAPGHICSL
jgi:AhpD family alkylhydroperoxidase